VHLTLPLLALIALAMAGSFCITVSPYRRPPLPLHLPGKERHPRLAALGALPRRFPSLPTGSPGVDRPFTPARPRAPCAVPLFPAQDRNPETGLLPPPGQYAGHGNFFPKHSGVTKGQPRFVRRCPRERRARGMVKLMLSNVTTVPQRTVPPGDEVNYWRKRCCHLCLFRLGTNPGDRSTRHPDCSSPISGRNLPLKSMIFIKLTPRNQGKEGTAPRTTTPSGASDFFGDQPPRRGIMRIKPASKINPKPKHAATSVPCFQRVF